MLEISILCVIALAMAYWTALYMMGRREDVLHGDFIRKAAPKAEAASAAPQRPTLPPLVLPSQPVVLDPPKPVQLDPPAPVRSPLPVALPLVGKSAIAAATPLPQLVVPPTAPLPVIAASAPAMATKTVPTKTVLSAPTPAIAQTPDPAPPALPVAIAAASVPKAPQTPRRQVAPPKRRRGSALTEFSRTEMSPTSFAPASLAPLPPTRRAPNAAAPEAPRRWPPPRPAAEPESLQSLLAIIKRNLGDAAAE